jgi:hypothetical protein
MCGDSTRGCYYSGATRVSLIDTIDDRIVNTVVIRGPEDAMTTLLGRTARAGERAPYVTSSHWVEHLFGSRPLRPGFWKYTATYPPDVFEDYEIQYSAAAEAFEGVCHIREGSPGRRH